MLTCTKIFTDIPFAHRQHTHAGHCRFIHGHNWAFLFEFTAREPDACGFVLDFGGGFVKSLKLWINDTFDHKLVLNETDPARGYLVDGLRNPEGLSEQEANVRTMFPFADIKVIPDASCEGLAKYLFRYASEAVYADTHGRVQVKRVTVYEDSKNSATFQP